MTASWSPGLLFTVTASITSPSGTASVSTRDLSDRSSLNGRPVPASSRSRSCEPTSSGICHRSLAGFRRPNSPRRDGRREQRVEPLDGTEARQHGVAALAAVRDVLGPAQPLGLGGPP